jgi:nickel/cobalt transporter (NicO) family protein
VNLQRASVLLLLVAALAFHTAPAWAHPLGNFTINHYAAIDARGNELDIAYVLDMAEIPTFEEIGRLDQAGMERHVTARLTEWHRGLHLFEDGAPIRLMLRAAHVVCLPGAGGLPTLRIEEDLRAEIPPSNVPGVGADQSIHLDYEDANFPARVGWKEVVVSGKYVEASSVPGADRGSNRLRNYPADLLKSPPDDITARFSVRPETSEADRAAASPLALSTTDPPIRLDLSGCRGSGGVAVSRPDDSAGGPRYAAETTAFGTLFKRLVGGPLSLQALVVVLIGAFALGGYHAMTPGHGKAILAAYFIGSRGTPAQAVLLGTLVTLTHTTGVFLLGFTTLAASRYVLPERLYPWLSMFSGVMLLGVGASLFVRRMKALGRPRDHEHTSHDPRAPHDHQHLHPAGEMITPRDLITLGVTGGILPCPSALVVMLAAISVGQVGLGLTLITAFSLGLAAALTAGGMLMLYSRAFVTRLGGLPFGKNVPPLWRQWTRLMSRQLPVVSAAIVALLGVIILVQTATSMGGIH